MDRRKCLNDPNNFCYICGLFTPQTLKKPISKNVRINYRNYFKCPLGDQDKYWAPHLACQSCVNHLNEWARGKRASGLPFAIPMIWREPKDHSDFYFCLCDITGITIRTRGQIKYPSLASAIRPVPHSNVLPVPKPILAEEETDESDESEVESKTDAEYFDEIKSKDPQLLYVKKTYMT